jgi:hypothetical protein
MALAPVPERPEPRIERMLITPKLAAEWLARNTHNRIVRPIVVDRYSGAMERLEWVFNGEAIKWSWDGVLLDGQHRLLAIVQSGVAIETLVIFDLPPDVQDSLDHHVPRALRDVLTLRGERSASDLAASIIVVYRFEQQRFNYAISPTIRQALDILDRYPTLRESLSVGHSINDAIALPRGMAAGTHCWFAQIDSDDADQFFARLVDGQGLAAGSPILAFREWALREFRVARTLGGRRPDRQRTLAYLIKSWNAWRDGAEMRQLRWSVGGAHPEPFPTPR